MMFRRELSPPWLREQLERESRLGILRPTTRLAKGWQPFGDLAADEISVVFLNEMPAGSERE